MSPITDADLQQLNAFLDGELSESERRFFQQRLSHHSELREYCERAWLASSVMKAQPFHLMPTNSVEKICVQCEPNPLDRNNSKSWAIAASFAAIVVTLGIAYQLNIGMDDSSENVTPSLTAQQNAPQELLPRVASTQKNPSSASNNALTQTKAISAHNAANSDDLTQFALNENTRAKNWPSNDQSMAEYVVRHNQLSAVNASTGLVSYAQMLADPEVSVTVNQAEQAQ